MLERFFLEERENEKNVELEQNKYIIMICITVRSRHKRFRLRKWKRLAIFQKKISFKWKDKQAPSKRINDLQTAKFPCKVYSRKRLNWSFTVFISDVIRGSRIRDD